VDDFGVVGNYVRPVDSLRTAIAQQVVVFVQHVSSYDLYKS